MKSPLTRSTVQPLRKESRHDTVAGREFADLRTDGFDHTGAIGHRNPVHGVGRIEADHGIVVEIQGAAMHPNLDFPGAGGRRVRQLDQFQAVKAAAGAEFHGFHAASINGSTPTRCPPWVMLRPAQAP